MNRNASRPNAAGRVYSENRKFRVILYAAVFALGTLLITLPFWAIDSVPVGTILASVGGVLIAFGFGAALQEWIDPTYESVQEAFAISVDPNVDGNLRDIVQKEVARAVADVASSSVEFGPRARLQRRLDIAHAERDITIQSISLSQKWQMTQLLEELLTERSELRVRICLMHPYSPHVARREEDLGFQPGTLRQLIDETVQPLIVLRNSLPNPERLEVRGYFATPYYGFSCCDGRRMVISLSREGRGGDQNLGIYLEASSESATNMVSDILLGFDRRWESSVDLLATASVSFVPGSEGTDGDKISFQISSTEPMKVNKFVISSASSRILSVTDASQSNGEYVYAVVAQYENGRRVQDFEVREALTAHNGWLRAPVRMVLPPPAST